MVKDAVDLASLRRALVIKLRHHGDVLLSSPVFSVLKNHAPQLEIDALVYHDTREMLTLHPAIDEVFTIDRAWKKRGPFRQLGAEWRLLKALRAREYDLLIHLTENPRGPVLTHLLQPRYSVGREFPTKRGRWWHASFTHLYKVPQTPRHTVETHLDALRRLGVYPADDERKLTLAIDHAAEQTVRSLLAPYGVREKQFVHVHPTSRWLFKCWTVEKYAALIDAVQAGGTRVVLTAAPDERELEMMRKITARLTQPAVDLSGQLTLKQLAALTRMARCFFGVDSVPMHIAAAVQTPSVALFGPSSDIEWSPWQAPHQMISLDYSCRPCRIDGCGSGKVSECITHIPVESVLSALRSFLAA